MVKNGNKTVRRVVSAVCIVLLVAALAAMPLFASLEQASDGPQASILSGTVQRQDISSVLIGGGTLTEETAQEVTIPSGVMLTEFLVQNGDAVNAGDPIAMVDRVSVMSAVAQVQETLDYLAAELEAAGGQDTAAEVIAQAGGTVKMLYAQEGDLVRDVMLEHGALAVLSLDGLMSVDLGAVDGVSNGDSVTVILSDETKISGRVVTDVDGTVTVTVTDDGYDVGEPVRVTDGDEKEIGRGTLSIRSPWNAAAYAGSVGEINVSVGETVSAGDTLIGLEDTGHTASYQQLADQHRAYEALLFELFQMYQSAVITSPGTGVISGIDENSIYLLSARGNWKIQLLANAPDGNDEAVYHHYVGQVTELGSDGWVLKVDPRDFAIADYKDLSAVLLDPDTMTESVTYVPQVPIYELTEEGEWQQIAPEDIGVGAILIFAGDDDGNHVWNICVSRGEVAEPSPLPGPEDPGEKAPSDPDGPGESDGPSDPGNTDDPSVPGDSTGQNQPSQSGQSSSSGEMSSMFSSGSGTTRTQTGGGTVSGGGYPQMQELEPVFETYDLSNVTVAAVTGQDTMTFEITVDELDLHQITLDQQVDVTVDALPGLSFAGTVTDIGNTGDNSGGNTKFTVTLTVDRAENMLPGMNATASITTDTVSGALTVPTAALNDSGAETYVYTGYDDETDSLIDPVTVTVGVSDGEWTEVLSGLGEGAAYYYAYYDTL